MAVSIATYGDRGWFVDNHNVLVDMYEGDWLAGHWYFVPATIHTSGFCFETPNAEQVANTRNASV